MLLLVFSLASSNLFAGIQREPDAARASQIGYSDGFVKGVRDREADVRTDYRRTMDYQTADRGYSRDVGDRARYQEAYRASFGRGYEDGVEGRPFSFPASESEPSEESAAPATRPRQVERESSRDSEQPVSRRDEQVRSRIPEDLPMRVELLSTLSTRENREGDKFTARVIEPEEFREATVEGHVAASKRAGRISGTSQLSLAFDSITLKDGETIPLSAQVEAVYDVEAGKVDSEGKVSGRTTRKRDALTVGLGAGIGAAVGAMIGGGAGAGIGAAIGGAAGATTVLATRGEDLDLLAGTELQIRTAGRKASSEPSRDR